MTGWQERADVGVDAGKTAEARPERQDGRSERTWASTQAKRQDGRGERT